MASSGDMVAFYDAWVSREEQILLDLTAALPTRRVDVLAPLVRTAIDHVASYYEQKARLADRDVLAALDPRWLNPVERAFVWAWGWKPALAFRFAYGVVGAGAVQRHALDEFRAATAFEERQVDRDVAAVQESLAGPRVLAALRLQSRRNGDGDDAMADVGRSLRELLATADALRDRTLRGVVELLGPEKAAAFVVALMSFHLRVRRAGRDWTAGP